MTTPSRPVHARAPGAPGCNRRGNRQNRGSSRFLDRAALLLLLTLALLLGAQAQALGDELIRAEPTEISESSGESASFILYWNGFGTIDLSPWDPTRYRVTQPSTQDGHFESPTSDGPIYEIVIEPIDNEVVDGDLTITATVCELGLPEDDDDEYDYEYENESRSVLSRAINSSLESECGNTGSATITIRDDDVLVPTASVEATDAVASKEGPDSGEVTVFLDQPAPSGGLILSYTTGGSAVPGVDYEALPGTVQIPNEATMAAIPIVPIASSTGRGDSDVQITLEPGSGYQLGSMTTATVVISDSEPSLGLEKVSGDGQMATEGQPLDPFVVKVTDGDGRPQSGVTVEWTQQQEPMDGQLSPTRSVTDAQGLARSTLTPGAQSDYRVKAQLPSTGASVLFSASVANVLAELTGLNFSERTVGRAIDILCPVLQASSSLTPGQRDLLERCSDLLTASVDDAVAGVKALTPGHFAVPQKLNIEFAVTQAENILTRILGLRQGITGISGGDLMVKVGEQAIRGDAIAGILDQVGRAGGGASADDAGFERLGFFINGTANWGSKDETEREDGFDFDTLGLTAGVDYRFAEGLVLGAALGYASTSTDIDSNGGDLDATSWSLSAYGTYYATDHFYIEGSATYGWDSYDQTRNIAYSLLDAPRRASADFDGNQLTLLLGGGYDFLRGPGIIDLYGRLRYVNTDIDSYSESGANGLDITVSSQDATSFKSILGVQYSQSFSTAKAVLLPQAWLEWAHEFESGDDTIEGRFVNDPTRTAFFLAADGYDSDSFVLGLGLGAQFAQGRTAFISYEAALGLQDYTQHRVTAGFRMAF